MAMGPGVCLEYGGMHRYDPSKPRAKKSEGGINFSLVLLLLAVVAVGYAVLVAGVTLDDVKKFL